jgi:hypothetical protein
MVTDNEILFTITKEDLQEEAIHYLGREMDEEEYAKAKKLLEFGIGENLRHTYWGIFFELMDKKQ